MIPDVGIRGRLRHLPSGLRASAVVCGVGALVGLLIWGLAGLAGMVFGVGLTVASFAGSSLVIAWADMVNPRLVLPVGMLTYVVKFTILGIAAMVLAATGWDGLTAFGIGIAAGTIGWAVGQAVWTWRAKIAYVDV
jgi:hypothetical protein